MRDKQASPVSANGRAPQDLPAVAAIADYRELFGMLLRQSFDGIALNALDTRELVEVSDSFCSLTGYTRDELIGRTAVQVGLVDADELGAEIARRADQGLGGMYRRELRRKDGEVRVVEFSHTLLPGQRQVLTVIRDVTESERREAQLKIQGVVTDLMDEGVAMVRARDGIIVYANATWNRMFGYDDGELLGRHVSVVNASTELTPAETAEHLTSILEREGEYRGEIKNVRKDGSTLWCSASVAELTHPEYGKVWMAVHTDITARKQAEDEFRGLLESSPDAIVIVDREAKIMVVNQQTETLFGYDRDDLVGKPVEVLVPRALRGAHARHRESYLADPRARPMGSGLSLHGRHKHGTLFPVAISLTPLVREHAIVVAATIRDATEQRASAQREHDALMLAKTRVEELGALLQAANTLTATLDRDAVLAEASGVLLRTLRAFRNRKYASAAVLRRAGDAVVTVGVAGGPSAYLPTFPIHQHPAVARAISSGRAWWCRRDDVDPRLQASGPGGAAICAPVHLGGQLYGVILAVSSDDEPFRAPDLDLAQGVADIVGLALGNAEHYTMAAEEAARMAALEKIKTDFLRVASHELRGPLAVIRGYLSLVEEGSLGTVPDPVARSIRVVSRKSDEMSRLVNQLIEAARLEDVQGALELEEIDLRVPVAEAVEVVRGRGVPDHDLVVVEPSDEVRVWGDHARLVTLLQNLVDNAVKYSPLGGRVEVKVSAQAAEAVVEVQDEGIGIAPEDLARLFIPFGRIVGPETASIPGTGLGLYLVREVARMHGGDVVVESEPGRGSRFRLILPLTTGSFVPALGGARGAGVGT